MLETKPGGNRPTDVGAGSRAGAGRDRDSVVLMAESGEFESREM